MIMAILKDIVVAILGFEKQKIIYFSPTSAKHSIGNYMPRGTHDKKNDWPRIFR